MAARQNFQCTCSTEVQADRLTDDHDVGILERDHTPVDEGHAGIGKGRNGLPKRKPGYAD